MSVDHLKKQSKNLKRLWPEFAKQHGDQPTLAACQELIARCSGYGSWHTAIKAEEAKVVGVVSDKCAEDVGQLALRKAIGALLACWPEDGFTVARKAGVTGNQIDSYVAGHHSFSDTEMQRIRAEFNLVNDTRVAMVDESTIYATLGCYVLYPTGSTRDFVRAYDELCRGGDAEFCAEVKPMSGPEDSSIRLVLMLGYETDVLFVVERGSPNDKILNQENLINMNAFSCPLPNTVYRALLKLAGLKQFGHSNLAKLLGDLISEYGVIFGKLRESAIR